MALLEHPSIVFAAQPKAFAPAPPEQRGLRRDEVRLLVASPDWITHTRFNTLPEHLKPGDAVVINAQPPSPARGTRTPASMTIGLMRQPAQSLLAPAVEATGGPPRTG